MKVLLLLIVAVCLAVAIVSPEHKQFEDFKAKYNKKYADAKEETKRFEIFVENLKRSKLMNEEAGETIYGVTKFSDLSKEEFKHYYLNYRSGSAVHKFNSDKRNADLSVYIGAPLPASFDWRDHGAVTPIKNQGQCGSCWAFSAVEAVESSWFLANHTLIELSPQQVVSCDDVDQGCNGGDTPTAYAYIIKAGGLELNSIYPYRSGGSGENGPCDFKKADVVASITTWHYITKSPQANETAMEVAIANIAPLSICVDAATWQNYGGGIIRSNCGQALDHCVMVTGYNTSSAGVNYWIVRNSWGTDWGIAGYLYVERGKNLCGIADEVTHPIAPQGVVKKH